MELTKKQIRRIRVDDLKETFESIKNMDSDGFLYRELTSIENAINFLEKN